MEKSKLIYSYDGGETWSPYNHKKYFENGKKTLLAQDYFGNISQPYEIEINNYKKRNFGYYGIDGIYYYFNNNEYLPYDGHPTRWGIKIDYYPKGKFGSSNFYNKDAVKEINNEDFILTKLNNGDLRIDRISSTSNTKSVCKNAPIIYDGIADGLDTFYTIIAVQCTDLDGNPVLQPGIFSYDEDEDTSSVGWFNHMAQKDGWVFATHNRSNKNLQLRIGPLEPNSTIIVKGVRIFMSKIYSTVTEEQIDDDEYFPYYVLYESLDGGETYNQVLTDSVYIDGSDTEDRVRLVKRVDSFGNESYPYPITVRKVPYTSLPTSGDYVTVRIDPTADKIFINGRYSPEATKYECRIINYNTKEVYVQRTQVGRFFVFEGILDKLSPGMWDNLAYVKTTNETDLYDEFSQWVVVPTQT